MGLLRAMRAAINKAGTYLVSTHRRELLSLEHVVFVEDMLHVRWSHL